ncbi:glycosyl transferase, group 1 [Calothrix sp. PCC 7716]|nr:glycosyl transferase, group 1 [Calothrix sp. PCC 7716]
MKLKILMLSTSLGLGGGDKEAIAITSNLMARGHQVKMVSMVAPDVMGLEAKSRGIDVDTLNMTRGIPDPRVVPKLITLIKKWQPDILHSHMIHANILARFIRCLVKFPVQISTAQNVDESAGKTWRNYAYRITDFLCDSMTNVSKTGVKRYIDIKLTDKNKIIFIPNSVDMHQFKSNSELREKTRKILGIEKQFTWLAVGRFYLQKDYPSMISAFAISLKKQPKSLLLIAGEGPLKTEIEKLVIQLGIQPNVQFLGPRRDIVNLMNAADTYLMSSAWEGMPLVLLEAAATGLPIVATDVGGIPETVLDNETGFLVPPNNPEALSAAMQKLMDMPQVDRLEMGKKGRKYVLANYSTNKIVDKWEELYWKILNKHNITL